MSQFSERFFNCSFNQIFKRNPSSCKFFAEDSIKGVQYCLRTEIDYLNEHFECPYLEDFTNVILSPDMLELGHAHDIGKQVTMDLILYLHAC